MSYTTTAAPSTPEQRTICNLLGITYRRVVRYASAVGNSGGSSAEAPTWEITFHSRPGTTHKFRSPEEAWNFVMGYALQSASLLEMCLALWGERPEDEGDSERDGSSYSTSHETQ